MSVGGKVGVSTRHDNRRFLSNGILWHRPRKSRSRTTRRPQRVPPLPPLIQSVSPVTYLDRCLDCGDFDGKSYLKYMPPSVQKRWDKVLHFQTFCKSLRDRLLVYFALAMNVRPPPRPTSPAKKVVTRRVFSPVTSGRRRYRPVSSVHTQDCRGRGPRDASRGD